MRPVVVCIEEPRIASLAYSDRKEIVFAPDLLAEWILQPPVVMQRASYLPVFRELVRIQLRSELQALVCFDNLFHLVDP